MAHDVFVSYATDDKVTADAVVAKLEQQQIRCWVAPRDIPPGKDYAQALVQAINGSSVLVLVFSSKANASPHVLREIERAASRGIPILPLRIEDVTPSESMEYFISGTHWLDALTPPLRQHLEQLTRSVASLLEADSAATTAEDPATGGGSAGGQPPSQGTLGLGGRWRDRPMLLAAGGAVAIALVAIIGGFCVFASDGDGDDSPAQVHGEPSATTPPGDATSETVATPAPEATVKAQPTTVTSGEVVQVSVGGGHTCALSTAGTVKCWGQNGSGQLGNGSTTASETPVYVCATGAGPPCTPAKGNVIADVTAISAGDQHNCALTKAGGIKCWGYNNSGQLGIGSTTNHTTPVDAEGLESGVTKISVGLFYSCAVTSGSGLKCWGSNGSGQLGTGTTTDRNAPAGVPGLTSGVADVATGTFHACALTIGGGLKCWGSNQGGNLGDGRVCGNNLCSPVNVSGLSSGVAHVAVGGFWSRTGYTCALTTAGGIKCWGRNSRGQLGFGSTDEVWEPGVDVLGFGSGVAAIAAGGANGCAVTEAGGIKCWGYNNSGQLGNGTKDTSTSPVWVCAAGALPPCSPAGGNVLNGVAAVVANGSRTCVVTTAGGVMCWGDNQLTPLEVLGLD